MKCVALGKAHEPTGGLGLPRMVVFATGAEMGDLTLFALGISSVVITAVMLIFLWHP